MSDKEPRNRTLLLWLAIIIVALTVIGAMSMIFDASRSFLGIVIILMLIPTVVLVFAMIVNPAKRDSSGSANPSAPLVADFPQENSIVIVPWQGHAALVHKAPSLPLSKLASEHDEFKPSALIINAEIVDARDGHTILTDFDPPIEFQVKFPETVIDNARKRASQTKSVPANDDVLAALQLGFWDGTRWVLFTKEKHRFRLLTTSGIVGVVTLKKWGDPPIGAGP